MKKILCLIESLGSGGAERQMTGLACMLKKLSMDVTVATYDPQDFYKKYLDDHGVETLLVSDSSSLFVRLWKIGKVLKYKRPDIVISYSRASSIISCFLKAMGAKYKLIASERNTTQTLSKPEAIKFYLYKYADSIVPNSYSQCLFIEKHYPNLSSRTKVITNFVDTDLFHPDYPPKRSQINNIIVVARVSAQKNVHNFISALRQIAEHRSDFHVKWFGSQSDMIYFSKCVEMVTNYKLSSFISFIKPTKNIANEYNNADFFCLPSLYEGYPNVICEAMSSGLPIVCSNICDNPHIVCEEENGYLFNPNSVDDIASTIEKMLALGEQGRMNMSLKNREKILKNNTKDAFMKKYLSIINDLNRDE